MVLYRVSEEWVGRCGVKSPGATATILLVEILFSAWCPLPSSGPCCCPSMWWCLRLVMRRRWGWVFNWTFLDVTYLFGRIRIYGQREFDWVRICYVRRRGEVVGGWIGWMHEGMISGVVTRIWYSPEYKYKGSVVFLRADVCGCQNLCSIQHYCSLNLFIHWFTRPYSRSGSRTGEPSVESTRTKCTKVSENTKGKRMDNG